jgi:hypothetical protein
MLLILVFLLLSLLNLISPELTLSPNSKTLTLNSGLGYLEVLLNDNNSNLYLDINSNYYNLLSNNSIFNNYFNLNNTGIFDIYYSLDNVTFINSNYTVQNMLYTNTNSNNVTFSNNLGGSDNTLVINTVSLWIVVAGILTTFTAVSIILILRIYYKYTINSFLYHIDSLHLNVYSDIPMSDEHLESDEIKLGLGISVVERTTILGGILTIIIFIISIFAITSYFYDSLSDNLQTIATFSLNNNNIIPLDESNINIQLIFYNIFYGECNCNDWNFKIINLPNIEPICTNLNNSNYYITDCMIEYQCNECAVNVGSDASFLITQSSPNIGYMYLDYSVSTNSYSGNNIISGSITTNSIFTGPNATSISLSIIPTSYINQYNDKFTGYVLDYQNTILGSTLNLTDYVDQNNYTSQISLILEISRNLSWYNIVQSVKYTNLIIFSQLFAIVGGIASASHLIFNFIATKTVRRILYSFFSVFFTKKNTEV